MTRVTAAETRPRARRRTATVAAAALTAVLALAGCAGATARTSAPAATPAPSVTVTTSTASLDDTRPAFGTSHTWRGGLRVTITKPVNHRLNRWAATLGVKAALRVGVTVVNRTGAPLRWSEFGLRASSAGTPARLLYEVNLGIRGLPTGRLADGATATFKLAYGVKDPQRFLIEVQPRPDDTTVQFHS